MNSFEERVCGQGKATSYFRDAAQEVFGSVAGRYVLSRLVKAASPLAHSEGMSPHLHGNCEVVAVLWKFGSPHGALSSGEPNATETKTNQD